MRANPSVGRLDLGAFTRHYLEMVLAMAAGMLVYGMIFGRGMAFSTYGDEAVMAAFMTAPMAGWMRYRGHSWRQAAEMAAAMLVPTATVVLALAGRPGVSGQALGMGSHAAMLLGMLVLMLARRAEYAHTAGCGPGGVTGSETVAAADPRP